MASRDKLSLIAKRNYKYSALRNILNLVGAFLSLLPGISALNDIRDERRRIPEVQFFRKSGILQRRETTAHRGHARKEISNHARLEAKGRRHLLKSVAWNPPGFCLSRETLPSASGHRRVAPCE